MKLREKVGLKKNGKPLHGAGIEPATPAVLRQCHNQLDHPRKSYHSLFPITNQLRIHTRQTQMIIFSLLVRERDLKLRFKRIQKPSLNDKIQRGGFIAPRHLLNAQ